MDKENLPWAHFFARTTLALIFSMAGLYKVFELGPVAHARNLFVEPYTESFLPVWALWMTGTVVPFVELGAGLLLLIGLWVRHAALALGAVLVLVTIWPSGC